MNVRDDHGFDSRTSRWRRRLDRVLAALASRIHQAGPGELRVRFEATVRAAFGFREFRVEQAGERRSLRSMVRDASSREVALHGGRWALRYELPEGLASGDAPLVDIEALSHLAVLVLALDGGRRPAARVSTVESVPVALVGSSAALRSLRARIAQVAATPFPVLVRGETGAGKEIVARLLHAQSWRASGPFVAVNCAAIVDSLLEAELFGIEEGAATGVRFRRGKFELASGGTIFLDEIGDLPPIAQAKLLRVLQDFQIDRVGGQHPVPVDVRVVAATNRDLAALVRGGQFRADLFYRLNGVEIDVPPLRARREDIDELVEYFLRRYADLGVHAIAPEALMALHDHDWPGNVRELERVIQRAMTLTDDGIIRLAHLPPAVTRRFEEVLAPALVEQASLREVATRYVRLVSQRCGHNRQEACRLLGISYHTLRAYLDGRRVARAHGVSERPAREAPSRATRAADRNDG